MRGLRLFWGAIVATILLWGLFIALREANAAAQGPPEAAQLGAVDAAAQWLVETHQNEDGGYTSFSTGAEAGPSDVGGTADAILALASTGYNVAAPYPGRAQGPVDFLRDNPEDAAAYAAQSGGANGKLILALTAASQDPRDFEGYDFTISLTQHLSPTGQYNVASPYEQGLAIVAQAVVSDGVPAEAVEWLLSVQAQEGELAGSWDDGFGTMGNVDATAMAMMALAAVDAEAHAGALSPARDFLMAQQLESGGWGYAPELPESANSTALAVQALSALGEDFYSLDGEWAVGSVSPLAALLAWQSASGALQADFGEGPADDFFTTVQALPALAGRAYPLPARHEAVRQAVACLATLQDADSAGWEEFPGTGANAGGTSRAIRAIVAHGGDLSDERWASGEQGPLEALEALAPAYLQDGRGGRVGIVMRGAAAAGEDVEDFGGLNLPVSMTTYLSPTGEYDNTAFGPFSHAQAMLGVLAAEQAVDASAEDWLLSAQGENGGWGDPDATGISLQVLAVLDEVAAHEDAIMLALENLQVTQQADGGWGFELPSSVNSTSEVAQGLTAVGENPFNPSWSVVMSGTLRNAADVALSQQGDNGCWPNLFGEGDDPYATTDGIILLSLSPPWGAGFESGPVAEPEAPAEVAATAEAEETPEVVVEETEVVPSPTAEEEVAQEVEAPETEALATEPPAEVEEPAATPTAASADVVEDADGVPLWIWVVAAVVLLALAAIFFALSRRRA